MQKHFAVVTGVGMLAVAGLVVSQSNFLTFNETKGSLVNSSESSSVSSTQSNICTGAGDVDCGGGVCCSTNVGYCSNGACTPYSSSSSVAACSNKTNSVAVFGTYTHAMKNVATAQALVQAKQACNTVKTDVEKCDEGCTGTNITRSFVSNSITCSFVKGVGHTCVNEGDCVFTRECKKS